MGFSTLTVAGAQKVTVGPSSVTVTTTGNIDDLDFSNADLIRFNNASLATLRGLKAGVDGQRVTIVSIGAGQVDLAHQNTNSAAANRFINFATSASTSLAAGSGTATYQYDATTARWRLIAHDQGAWITPAYNAGDYTASGSMTWTVDSGDVFAFRYRLSGRMLTVNFAILSTSVGGTLSNGLKIKIPGGFSSAFFSLFAGGLLSDAGATDTGCPLSTESTPGGTNILISKFGAANMSAATNTTNVYGTFPFEVQ